MERKFVNMSRGRRYNSEPKLNIKKVIAVILILIVLVVFMIAIKKLTNNDTGNGLQTTEYYSVYTDGKWGVIDSKANMIIDPTYEEMIVIPDHTKDLFICFENVNYEENSYKTKIVNAKNKEILKQYTQVTAIENYDKNHNLWYEENVLRYKNSQGKYGLIDFNGKVLIEATFDKIDSLEGTTKVLLTEKNGKLGLVDDSGKEVIPNQYVKIEPLGKNTNLYIVKDEQSKYGIYEKTDTKYQEIKSLDSNEYFCVKENGAYEVIDKKQEKVFHKKVDDIIQIKDHIIVYQVDKKMGAYDIDSKKEIKCEYDLITYTSNNYFIVKKDASYGIINIEGEVKRKIRYANIIYYEEAGVYELETKNNTSDANTILNNNLQKIAEGILEEANGNKSYIKLWTEEGYQYYNLEGESKEAKDILLQNNLFLKKENGTYGYVDKEGNTIVECTYDDAKEQNNFGYAAVKKDGKWGAIDSTGKVVCTPQNDLDGYLLIDFIGEYHLGKDINLMYYTK